MPQTLLTQTELAERLRCSPRHLLNLERDGLLPRAIRLSPRFKRWDSDVVDAWIAAGCPRVDAASAEA